MTSSDLPPSVESGRLARRLVFRAVLPVRLRLGRPPGLERRCSVAGVPTRPEEKDVLILADDEAAHFLKAIGREAALACQQIQAMTTDPALGDQMIQELDVLSVRLDIRRDGHE